MKRIDPDRGWQILEKHLSGIRDERRRAVLGCVVDHLRAEATADFEGLLKTLAPDPQYRFWVEGSGFSGGPKGLDAVKSHYVGLYRERRHVCDWEIDRVVVDEHTAVTEGWFDQLFPGSVMRKRGVEIDAVDAVYALRMRMVIVWPVDADAKLIGEDSYINGSMFSDEKIRKLPAEQIPARFHIAPP